jgi:hypothetical protein
MPDLASITLPDNNTYDFKDVIARESIPFGIVDATSTSKAFTATVAGITSLIDGTTVMLKNGVVTSASGFTININGLGAKPVYNNMAAATAETTIFNVSYTMLFVYDSTRVSGGCWICYRGYDANTNTIGYQLRTNSTVMTVTDTARYYKLYFTSADGKHWVPASVNSTNNATTARPVNQRPINPFGRIVYTSASTSYTAGSNLAATTIWSQYAFVLGYSFNRTGAELVLTTKTPVYIKCAPQTDGSAIMDADTPYVQALPSTADGKIYIYLGIAYDATHVELYDEHPVYWHDGTGIRLWSGSASATIDVDSALSSTSENPVQNKVINSALNNKADSSALSNYLPKSGGEMTGDISYTSGGSFSIGNTFDYISFNETNQSSTQIGIVADEISFTGDTVTAPTPTVGTNNTQIATTAFVNSAVAVVKSTGTNSGAGGDLNYTDASGLNSLAYGGSATASGEGAVAFSGAIASGDFSLSHGRQWANANYTTTASGTHSLAFGLSAKAEGNESLAFGQGTTATGNYGVALGNQTTAGGAAFAMGQKSSATGALSTTIGNELLAPGRNAFVIGQYNIEDTDDGSNYTDYGSGAKKYVFTVGNGTKVNNVVTRSNALTLDWNGNLGVNSAQLNNLNLPTTSGGSSYGSGTNGQIIKSNGTTNYWGNLSTSELTNDSGFITGMFIGSYGSSTYADILAAYKANKVVYCRASSNSNPATGSQTRMAFLAYVNNAETPTEFEFQYYRSVSTHTESQQGDQVYIYKINSTTGWSVTVRNAFSAVAAGTGLSRSYSNGTVTLALSSPLPSVTSSDNGKVLTVVNGAWAAASLPTYNGGVS